MNDNTSTANRQSNAFENEKQTIGINKRIFGDGSSTDSDAVSKIADIIEKDIDQLIRNDRRTPKILKHILWLVLFAFITTSVIAAIITGLFINESIETKQSVHNLESALYRGIYSAHVMSLLRSLINYELNIEGNLMNTKVWSALST